MTTVSLCANKQTYLDAAGQRRYTIELQFKITMLFGGFAM